MKKRKVVIPVILAIVGLALAVLIGTGWGKRTDVILTHYSVSEDGSKLTFQTAIASSMGYTRGFEDKGGGIKPHYLVFYSTFGGLNSDFGAKDEFVLELSGDDTEIYFNRSNGGYELVLKKSEETGAWTRP